LEYLDFIMRSIHSHTAKTPDSSKISDPINLETNKNEFNIKNATFSPPILLVGTNKQSLNPLNMNDTIERKFEIIREFVRNKTYEKHIVQPYFAIETHLEDVSKQEATQDENEATFYFNQDLNILRQTIKTVALNEPYMGEQQPLKWMNFEKSLDKLKSKGLFYASLSQVNIIIKFYIFLNLIYQFKINFARFVK
jgi:hypothetical protein